MMLGYFFNIINRKEFTNPPFLLFNERPVEYRYVFEQISKYYPKSILDVGTGTTALPHLMANCGCRVTAIDNISDYWRTGMHNRHYLVINDDITDTKLNEKFDLITCISTLEHIENCDAALVNMFSLLNEMGHVVLTFPYNESRGVENVYALSESGSKKNQKYRTRAYSRSDLEKWSELTNAEIVHQEYWQFFTGDYWTVGDMIFPPVKVNKGDKHQISCVVFQKKKI